MKTFSRLLILSSIVAMAGGFLFGFDTAVINGANQYLVAYFKLSPFQEGIAGASAILGCIPGAMFAGGISDRHGRRKVLFLCAILFAVSGVFSAVPHRFDVFLAARFVGGLGIGVASMICPVYIAELAPARHRGLLGSLFQFGIVTGILITLLVNSVIQGLGDEAWNTQLGWRWMLGAEVLPAAGLLGLLCFAPESPRWLLQRGRVADANALMARIAPEVDLAGLQEEVQAANKAPEARFWDLLNRRNRNASLLAVVLMAGSQFSGINAIMYYSTKIFSTAGSQMDQAFRATVLVGVVNFLFTLVAMAFVDRAGRRPLLLAGLGMQTIVLFAVGGMLSQGVQGLVFVAGILLFIASFAVALGPLPWIICAEIFPTAVRGRAMSVATFVIWVSCYAVAQLFPVLNDSAVLGPAGTFGLFGLCSLALLVFVYFRLPETKGRSLEEL